MCIYCNGTNYRKIYESHHGPIPVDEDGKTYHIHHVDGNKNNHNPYNLEALSIQEHYDRHFAQGDYLACKLLAYNNKLSKKELESINPFYDSEFHRTNALKRISNNTHNFQDKEWRKKDVERRKAKGYYDQLAMKGHEACISSGNFALSGNIEKHKQWQKELIDKGKHHSQIEHVCPHCKKSGRGNTMFRHHFDNCKSRVPTARDTTKTLPITTSLTH